MKVKKLVSVMLVFVLTLTMIFTFCGCKTNNDLTIDSYRLCKDKNNDDIIIIKFHFVNNTGFTTSMSGEYYLEVFQGDIELEEYFPYESESDIDLQNDYNDYSRRIKDGGEYYPEMAFYLEDTNTDVEIIIEPYASLFSKERTEIIKLK